MICWKRSKKKIKGPQNARQHFAKRFQERIGYKLTDKKYLEIKELIYTNGVQVNNRNNSNLIFKIPLDGYHRRVVYNSFGDYLVTIW